MDEKEKYTRILTLALEIEGLAVLMQRRGDMINPEIHGVLSSKVNELASLVGINTEVNNNRIADTDKTESIDNSPLTEAVEGKTFNESVIESNDTVDDISDLDAVFTSSSNSVDKKQVERESESSQTVKPEEWQEEERKEKNEIAAAVELEQAEDSIVTESRSVSELLKKFTLNDRFRFRREIFGGVDDDFKTALNDIASMTSEDEIREYLEDDLCLDLENPDVRDFYEVVITGLSD